MKKFAVLAMLLSLTVVTIGCKPAETTAPAEPAAEPAAEAPAEAPAE